MAEYNIIVLDNGSDTIKAGYCIPEREPLLVTPSAARAAESERVVRCVERGEVVDWDVLESVYHHAFYEQLGWKAGEEGAVLVCEPQETPKASRELLAQLLFEQFNVAGVYFADAPVMALYAAGRLTGTAVDVGADKIDVCPVFDGAACHAGARRLPYAGRDLDAQLAAALGGGVSAATVRAVKEASAFAAESADAFAAARLAGGTTPHVLPDGTALQVPTAELARCGEALVDPRGAGASAGPRLADEILGASQAGGGDQRRALLETLVLAGGGAGMRGFQARLMAELAAAAPASLRPAVAHCPEYMHDSALRYGAFTGGCIAAKTVFPQAQHVDRGRYNDAGPACVRRSG